eukprot:Lankesteria_metandrocarpae@DN10808_c0_g1_i1.p1
MKLRYCFILFVLSIIVIVEAVRPRSHRGERLVELNDSGHYNGSLFEEVARKSVAPLKSRSGTNTIPQWDCIFGSDVDKDDMKFFMEITKVLTDADLASSLIVGDFAAAKFVRIVRCLADVPKNIPPKEIHAMIGLDRHVVVYWDVTAQCNGRTDKSPLVVDELELVFNNGISSVLYPSNISFVDKFCVIDIENWKLPSHSVPFIGHYRLELINEVTNKLC